MELDAKGVPAVHENEEDLAVFSSSQDVISTG